MACRAILSRNAAADGDESGDVASGAPVSVPHTALASDVLRGSSSPSSCARAPITANVSCPSTTRSRASCDCSSAATWDRVRSSDRHGGYRDAARQTRRREDLTSPAGDRDRRSRRSSRDTPPCSMRTVGSSLGPPGTGRSIWRWNFIADARGPGISAVRICHIPGRRLDAEPGPHRHHPLDADRHGHRLLPQVRGAAGERGGGSLSIAAAWASIWSMSH